MSDWDDSSEEDTTSKAAAAKPKSASNWDDSSDEDETTKSQPQSSAATSPAKSKGTEEANDDWESSEEPNEPNQAPQQNHEESANQNGAEKSEEAEQPELAESEQPDPLADAERIRKLAKKMKNYKSKQKRKAKRKKRQQQKKQSPQDSRGPQKSKKGADGDSSSDSSDDAKPQKQMVSYAERMATDNDILFKGHEAAKAAMNNPRAPEPKKQDDRVMLSGEVTLKNFPLGSTRDCEHLADEVSAILDQQLFEEAITASDVFAFYHKLLAADILQNLDMVDTKALVNKTNALLKQKQKAWHKKKNPTGKKKKKPQWIVSDKFGGNGPKSGNHREGQFDAGDFDLFD